MAAPSSAHTSPSQTTSTAPTTHPIIACGPFIAAMMSGMVMKGPTPIMSIMLSVVAPASPTPRINCGGSAPPAPCPGAASVVAIREHPFLPPAC
jgi:hypothetical protein